MSYWDEIADGPEPPEWVCPNRDCRESWDEIPRGEIITCEFEHCPVETCPTCVAKCFSCNRTLCEEHWMYAELGDGIRKYDRECLEDFVENNPELVAFRRAS